MLNRTQLSIKLKASLKLNFHLITRYIFKNTFHLTDLLRKHISNFGILTKFLELNKLYRAGKYLPNTLMIGSNGSSEFIAIEYNGVGYQIVLSPFIDMNKKYHIEIGISFTDFLERLANGKEWFE